MRFKISDLNPKAQEQVQRQIAAEDARRTAKREPIPLSNCIVDKDTKIVYETAVGDKNAKFKVATGKRLRQDSKPSMNKLERAWFDVLSIGNHEGKVVSNLRAQALRFKLGNGHWYKVDISCRLGDRLTAFEVKGPKSFRGGFENLKSAAFQWPDWDWFLVWKDPATGAWTKQHVLP